MRFFSKVSLGFFCIVSILLSFIPIYSRDALKLNVAFADLWKDENFLFFRKFNSQIELGMMNIQYLYSKILSITGSDNLIKIVHTLFLLLAGFLLYKYLIKRVSEEATLVSILLFISVPINIKLTSIAYVDLFVLFFSTATIIYLFKWIESDSKNLKYLILLSIFAGLCIGTKYNGIILAFLVGLTIIYYSIINRGVKKGILHPLLYTLIIALLISPWLYRNYQNSGNPFYPVLDNVFPSHIEKEELLFPNPEKIGDNALRKYNGETFLEYVLIPLRIFFEGKDDDPLKFDGVLNPFMFLLLPLIFIIKGKHNKIKHHLPLLFLFILSVLFTSLYIKVRIRYGIFLIVPLTLLIAYGYDVILSGNKKYKVYLVRSFVILSVIYSLNYTYNLTNEVKLKEYLLTSQTKEEYLEKNLLYHDIYKFINDSLPEDAVIYDIFCGSRYYYVKKDYINDDINLDRYFYNRIKLYDTDEELYKFLSNIPNTDNKKATHLFINVQGFINSIPAVLMFDSTETKQKTDMFINFLKKQKVVQRNNNTYLFEINYEK